MKSWRGIIHVFSSSHWRQAMLQRHILRDRRPGTTACPGCWASGAHRVKKVAVRKKNYFVLTWRAQQTQPMKDPYHLYRSPHLLRFQPETQRQATSMTACTGCLAMGINKVKKCFCEKIIFCTGLTRAAKAGQKSIITAQAQRTNQGWTPFIQYVLQEPQFESVSA